MNILFICNRTPYPPDKGERIRSFHLIRHLSRKHTVFLYSLSDIGRDAAPAVALKKYCAAVHIYPVKRLISYWRMIGAFVSGRPLTAAYFYSRRMKKDIERFVREEKVDLIFAYCSSSAQYVTSIDGMHTIVDFVDIDSDKWEKYSQVTPFPLSLIYAMESKRLRCWEKKMARLFDLSIVTTETEREKLEVITPGIKGKVRVVVNGIDFEHFTPATKRPEGHALIFTGQMNYRPNVDAVCYFCREILPLIKKQVPDAVFTIVGRDPSIVLRRSCTDAVITGEVTDIMDYLAKAAVYVAPLRMSFGVSNKVLEAMAAGLPVVATSSILDGIKAVPQRDLLIADTAQEFARQIIYLLHHEDARVRLAENARTFVRANHGWDTNLRVLDDALELFC